MLNIAEKFILGGKKLKIWVIVVTLALLSLVIVGCGGGGSSDNGSIAVRIDYISTQAARPVLGLIRVNPDGSFTTEAHTDLPTGSNLRETMPMPRDKDLIYLVVVFNDYDNDGRYDYSDYEELGVWDGYLVYEGNEWAGYGLSDDAYLFRDVRDQELNVYTDYVRSLSVMRSSLKPRTLIEKAPKSHK